MKKQNRTWRRALISSAARTVTMTAALPIAILGTGALVGCDTVRSTSSSTNWLMCTTDANCRMFPGATCNDDLICVDAAGDPIPANTSQDGLVAGGGNNAGDECEEGAQTTLCLNAGGAEAGGTTSGGSGGATLSSSGATASLDGAGGGGGASFGGTGGTTGRDSGGASAGGVSSDGMGGGGAEAGGASSGGASNAGAGGSASGEACDCVAGAYCEQSSCDLAAPGVCAAIPELCPANFAPVCGCNGATYPNACNAASAGINVDTTGAACEEPRVVLTAFVDGGTYGPMAQWYNGTEESIFLRGCSTVDAWYRDGSEWIEYGALANCAVETEIVEVAAGTHHFDPLPAAPERGDGVWRLVGPYGVGCTPGSLFSDGECDETFEVTSYNETDWGR